MTAAHCVAQPGTPEGWHSSIVVVPGYNRGERPHGVFPARAVLTPASWPQDGENDVAMAVVDPVGGRHLSDVVGGQPVAFGRKPAAPSRHSATRRPPRSGA